MNDLGEVAARSCDRVKVAKGVANVYPVMRPDESYLDKYDIRLLSAVK